MMPSFPDLEPNDVLGDETCVRMRGGMYNDALCDDSNGFNKREQQGYICEYTYVPDPTEDCLQCNHNIDVAPWKTLRGCDEPTTCEAGARLGIVDAWKIGNGKNRPIRYGFGAKIKIPEDAGEFSIFIRFTNLLLHLPNVLLVVTMTNLEIQTPLVPLVMLANTALLVIGVLVELAMPTLQVMHVQLVLTQKEKEGHPTSTVTIVRKGIIAPQQVQLHRCLVRPEHINRPQEEQHVTNVMLEWLVHLDYHNLTIFVIMVITAQKVQIIQTVGEPFPTGSWVQGILLLLALLEHKENLQCLPGTWSNRTSLESPDECWSCPKGWKCTFGTNQLDRGDVTPIYALDLSGRPEFISDQYFGNRFFRPGETQAGFQIEVFS